MLTQLVLTCKFGHKEWNTITAPMSCISLLPKDVNDVHIHSYCEWAQRTPAAVWRKHFFFTCNCSFTIHKMISGPLVLSVTNSGWYCWQRSSPVLLTTLTGCNLNPDSFRIKQFSAAMRTEASFIMSQLSSQWNSDSPRVVPTQWRIWSEDNYYFCSDIWVSCLLSVATVTTFCVSPLREKYRVKLCVLQHVWMCFPLHLSMWPLCQCTCFICWRGGLFETHKHTQNLKFSLCWNLSSLAAGLNRRFSKMAEKWLYRTSDCPPAEQSPLVLL